MNITKDPKTQALREQVMAEADFLIETERADALLIALSFQSLVRPERHVWIDTKGGDGGDEVSADLEDWTHQDSWDNAVATVDAKDDSVIRDVVRAWLRGEPLDACLRICGGCKVVRK